MSKVRLRRLTTDYQHLYEYVHGNPRVELVQAIGNPPEKYQLCYQVRSLQKDFDPEPVLATRHMVEIVLPRDYPRTPPLCRMLTPVFHPNIAPHAICIGDHWSAGEPLWSMVSRIGEMLAYQSFNVKSPLNGEAARWVEQNMDKVPLDAVCMIPDSLPGTQENAPRPVSAPIEAKEIPTVPSPPSQQTNPVSSLATESPKSPLPVASVVASPVQKPVVHSTSKPQLVLVACPGCNTKFRIKQENQGKQFQCPRCKTAFK